MEDSGSETGAKFKVVDRRRFDAEGTSKSATVDSKPEVKPRPEPQPQAMGREAPAEEPAGAANGISFPSFIMSLATQAMMQMGEMAPPDGMPFSPDIEGARQTISIIEMLKAKTSGNLDAEEIKLITDILHSLKLRFVRAAKR